MSAQRTTRTFALTLTPQQAYVLYDAICARPVDEVWTPVIREFAFQLRADPYPLLRDAVAAGEITGSGLPSGRRTPPEPETAERNRYRQALEEIVAVDVPRIDEGETMLEIAQAALDGGR